jgi:uncharacterized membrane protein YfcA
LAFLQFTFPISGVETSILIPPLVAFGISFFTSMGGLSGAFLLLPFQMSVLGFTSPSVTSTNFLFNVTGTPGGVYRYARERRFVWPVAILIVAGVTFYCLIPIDGAVATPDWLLGILFGAGGLMGMYLGARVQKYAPSRWIKLMLGSVIIIVALKYILRF